MHLTFLWNILGFTRLYIKEKLPPGKYFSNLLRYRVVWYMHEMEVDEFFQYHLYREELSREEYSAFVGWKKHIKTLIAVSPVQYRCLTENKLNFFAYCEIYKIPTPKVYAVYDPQLVETEGLRTLRTIDELTAFLKVENLTEFVLKPTEGTRGLSVLVLKFDREKESFSNILDQPVDRKDLEEKLHKYDYRGSSQSNFLLQQRLTPHESTLELSRYVPFSYRVVTMLDEHNQPEVVEVYAKAAVGDSDTDNWEGGGMTLRIDDNGICYGGNYKKSRFELVFSHPTNNFSLVNWQVPFYKDVCELGLRCAAAFHYVRLVAWDIIAAREGVFVVEGNNPFSVLQQEAYFRGLWQGTLARVADKAFKEGPRKSPWW